MISVAEALERALRDLRPVGTEYIPISDGLGRVLSESIVANVTYPPSDVSAMDGYAVIATDTASCPVTLRQIGMSQAGHGFDGRVSKGETVRIFTGAAMPTGADSIVVQENTTSDGDAITIQEAVDSGTFVRAAGLDFSQGDILRETGHRLTARDLGLLAAANVADLPVFQIPKVAYLATGDELVMPGDTPGPNQIISSNSIAMDAYIRAFGGEPVCLGIAQDNAESLRQALSGLSHADMLVTMGGASVGDFDLVQSVLDDEGMQLGFYKVAMRPGKPLIFGNLNGVPMLGLPGNPVSSGVTALLFLKPAITRLSGARDGTTTQYALLGMNLPANDQRQDYLRASLQKDSADKLIATPFQRQDSSMMRILADSECLVVRPPNAAPANAGDVVEIVVFDQSVIVF